MTRTPFFAAALAAMAVLGLAACTAAPLPVAPTPDALTWSPDDPGMAWDGPEITVVEPAALGTCASGSSSVWRSGAAWVQAIVWDCRTDLGARGLVTGTLSNSRAYPATDVTPALGDGVDVAVHYTDGSLARYWSQGRTYVAVARSCEVTDCIAVTGGYAQELSEALPGTPNPLLDPPPTSDPLASYSPAQGTEPWMPVGDLAYAVGELPVPECESGRQRTWVSGDLQVASVFTMDCPNAAMALRAYTTQWGPTSGISLRPDIAGVIGSGYDSAGQFTPNPATFGITRSWIQGSTYVNVQRLCAPDQISTCESGSGVDAQSIVALLPGDPVADFRVLDQTAGLLLFMFGVPVAALAVFAIARVILMRRRQRGYAVTPAHPGFTDVGPTVRRARTERWIRRAVVVAVTTVGWVSGLFLFTGAGQVLPFGLWFFFGAFVLAMLASVLLGLLWRPGPLHRVARGAPGRPTRTAVAGATLRVLARVAAIAAIVLYVFAAVLYVIVVRSQTPAVTASQIESGFAGTNPIGWMLSLLETVIVGLDRVGGVPLLFVVLVVGPLTLAYVLDRLGRRFGQRSLQAVLQTDTRPHFLYLRGFEEDALRVDASLTRRGFIQALTPFGRPRFEEILVGYLSRFGPVIAISARDQRIPDIGAAKMSFGGGEWQERVREWMTGSRAIVMAATPAQVRRGLEWEIAQIAASGAPRIMLVVAPWPRTELARRWQGFLAKASSWPLFAPLATDPFPSGVEVLTWTDDSGWRGYGSTRRWDWSYAAAILAAVEDAAPEWDTRPATVNDNAAAGGG